MKLHNLSPAEGSVKENFRKGRGAGSGNGKTAGKGPKGNTEGVAGSSLTMGNNSSILSGVFERSISETASKDCFSLHAMPPL